MAASAESSGLTVIADSKAQLDRLAEKNDYVRVRYMVVDTTDDINPNAVLALTKNLREAVLKALKYDEFGNPTV